MTDITNPFPSWGEAGASPPNGFFYEGGDQVNEKHLDYLWDNMDSQTSEFITAIEQRVKEIEGNIILDDGLVVSDGSGTREVDITASSEGAYVDGQATGSTSSTTLTLPSNGTGSTRTDVIYVNESGTVAATAGTTTVSSGQLKLAEADVADGGDVTAVRNYARDRRYHIASENAPDPPAEGDLWHDRSSSADELKVYEQGSWHKLLSDQDDVTVTAGDGLKGGGTLNLDAGSTTLDIEPDDFAGNGLKDDGSDNLAVEPADFAGTGLQDDGADNLELDGSAIDASTLDGDSPNSYLPRGINIVTTQTTTTSTSGTVYTNTFDELMPDSILVQANSGQDNIDITCTVTFTDSTTSSKTFDAFEGNYVEFNWTTKRISDVEVTWDNNNLSVTVDVNITIQGFERDI